MMYPPLATYQSSVYQHLTSPLSIQRNLALPTGKSIRAEKKTMRNFGSDPTLHLQPVRSSTWINGQACCFEKNWSLAQFQLGTACRYVAFELFSKVNIPQAAANLSVVISNFCSPVSFTGVLSWFNSVGLKNTLESGQQYQLQIQWIIEKKLFVQSKQHRIGRIYKSKQHLKHTLKSKRKNTTHDSNTITSDQHPLSTAFLPKPDGNPYPSNQVEILAKNTYPSVSPCCLEHPVEHNHPFGYRSFARASLPTHLLQHIHPASNGYVSKIDKQTHVLPYEQMAENASSALSCSAYTQPIKSSIEIKEQLMAAMLGKSTGAMHNPYLPPYYFLVNAFSPAAFFQSIQAEWRCCACKTNTRTNERLYQPMSSHLSTDRSFGNCKQALQAVEPPPLTEVDKQLIGAIIRKSTDAIYNLLSPPAIFLIQTQAAALAARHAQKTRQYDVLKQIFMHSDAFGCFEIKRIPLLSALIVSNELQLTRQFLNTNHADCNEATTFGITPLMFAAQQENPSFLITLLRKKCLVNQTDITGKSAIFYAIQHDFIVNLKYLIRAGAELNLRGENGKTPLFAAEEARSLNAYEQLLHSGADPNRRLPRTYETVLMHAARDGLPQFVLPTLIYGGDIDARNYDGETALILAIQNRHVAVARILLQKGAHVHYQTYSSGQDAWLIAQRNGIEKAFCHDLERVASQQQVHCSRRTDPEFDLRRN